MTAFRILCWLSWALSIGATQFGSFSPAGHNELTFSIHVPLETANSSSGPIYFQLNSTREVNWFALGQGTQMSGANIFVVYTAGNDVTVSPRLGKGHVQPLYNKDAKVSVLGGSGNQNGVITANVRCDSCLSWDGGSMDPTDSASPWIWAVKYGRPLSSKSLTAPINEHDDKGTETVDLKKATGGNSANPFVDLSTSSNATSGDTGSSGDWAAFEKKKTAHAVLMIVAFVLLFPIIALAIHLVPSSSTVAVHGYLQLFTLAVAITGMGLGISMADETQQMGHYHPIIGIVVVASLVLFQPLMGLLQHRHFRKTGGKAVFAYFHRWFGRIMIILGIINAGFGFQLSGIGDGAPRGAVIAYGVVAGVIGVVYILVVSLVGRRRNVSSA